MTQTLPLAEAMGQDRYRLRDGVYSAVDRGGIRRLVAWPRAISLGRDDEHLRAVLQTLSTAQTDRAGLGHAELITALRRSGWLAWTVVDQLERPLYTIHPWAEVPAREDVGDEGTPIRLSRFALLHPPESRRPADADSSADHLLVVERPGAWCEIRIHDPAVVAAIVGDASQLSPAMQQRLRTDLRWTGMAVPDDAETDFRHQQWSSHELWFHDRSRLGRRGYLGDGFGGTFWARGHSDPLPPEPEPYAGHRFRLHRPDLARLRGADPSLTAVLEDRRSLRDHDPDNPITAGELGDFLFRTCRAKGTFVADGVTYLRRPYPSGGSVGELEIYPLVTRVEGLPAALYHYDSTSHELVTVASDDHPAVQRLLRVAGHSTVVGRPPQVLIMIAARAGRLMWKYEGMAYALMLKHAGVLVQTMYCVATAMRLAPCGLGSGDSVAFAEVTGRDPMAECPVGEFALGRPASRPAHQERAERMES